MQSYAVDSLGGYFLLESSPIEVAVCGRHRTTGTLSATAKQLFRARNECSVVDDVSSDGVTKMLQSQAIFGIFCAVSRHLSDFVAKNGGVAIDFDGGCHQFPPNMIRRQARFFGPCLRKPSDVGRR